MPRRFVLGTEGGAYSAVVVTHGDLAFVSAHGPEKDGVPVHGTIEEETRLTLSRLLKSIEAIGGRKDEIIRCNCFLSNISDFPAFDDTYRRFFGELFPARTTVGAALYNDIKVEIDAVVAVSSSST